MDPNFPLTERSLRKLNSETEHPALLLCQSSWVGPLSKILTNPLFSFKEWEDQRTGTILSEISGFKTIIVAFSSGEDLIAAVVRERLKMENSDAVVLRLLRDVFMKASLSLGGQMAPQENWKTGLPGSPTYFVFATPRSGSTFICDILGKTKLLGHPREHLLADLLPAFFNTDLTFNEWIRTLVKHSFTPNGYSSTKLISHLFLEVLENYNEKPALVEDLLHYFKAYPVIYLIRSNKVRQAISLIIAKKTAVWHIKNEKQVTSSQVNLTLDDGPDEIENMMVWFKEQEKQLEDFFRKAGIVPHVYFYEDFSDELKSPAIYKEIAQYLNVSFPDEIPEPNYSVMSDEHNEALVRNYYEYLDKKIRDSDYPREPVASLIMSSMMAEMEYLTRKSNLIISPSKSSNKKWWKLF